MAPLNSNEYQELGDIDLIKVGPCSGRETASHPSLRPRPYQARAEQCRHRLLDVA